MRPAVDMVAVLRRWGPLLLAAAVLVWHSLLYGFVTDDAYISFVYSRNLAEHGALVFNPGMPPVEGYTNFLWTALLGALMWVGVPPEISSLVLGTGFALATLVVVFRLSARLLGGPSLWDGLAPALLALSSGYACWASGGLETQMFTFFVVLALASYARGDSEPRALRRVGVALALAAMTRPEGLLVAGVLGLHRLALNGLRDRRLVPGRDELSCVAWFLAIWAPWFAWRWWYYGHLFPNTYYVKAAGPATEHYREVMFDNGLYYVWQWARQSGAVFAAPLAVVGLIWARPRSARFVFGSVAFVLATVYLAYTVRVGGDFMGLHRFVMPVFVVVALGTALGLRRIVGLVPAGAPRIAVTVALVGGVLVAHAIAQAKLTAKSMPKWRSCEAGDEACIDRLGRPFWPSDHGIDTPSYLALYAHDRALIGERMRDCFEPDDVSIFGGVGAKPFYARARGFDVFGLVSEEIAHEVPRTRPRAGHNKWGPSADLVRWYDPDFVFHCYSLHSDPARPRLNCSPGFWLGRGYELVTMHVPGLVERGEYYTFLAREERAAELRATCEGVVSR